MQFLRETLSLKSLLASKCNSRALRFWVLFRLAHISNNAILENNCNVSNGNKCDSVARRLRTALILNYNSYYFSNDLRPSSSPLGIEPTNYLIVIIACIPWITLKTSRIKSNDLMLRPVFILSKTKSFFFT